MWEEKMPDQPPNYQQSSLWHKALENFREELAADDDLKMILQTHGAEQLLHDTTFLRPVGSPGRKALDSINRLKPMIKFVNNFSAALAVAFGADSVVTALVWGSIRMILTVSWRLSR